MTCPVCAAGDLVQDTRDLAYAYKGTSTVLPAVCGEVCSACGEAILGAEESARVSTLMLDFNKEIDAAEPV